MRSEGQIDYWLGGTALLIVIFGLVMVYSASSPIALKQHHDPTFFALRNGVYALLGMVVLAVASRLDLESIRTLGRVGMWVCLGLLFITLIPGIGHSAGGAQRWINLRVITFQPSEPFKLLFVLYLANYLESDATRALKFTGGVLNLIVVYALAALLLMLEPDFGSTVIAGAALFGMIFVAGVPLGWITMLMLAALPAAATAIIAAPYRFLRVTSFLDPWDDPLDSDFQLGQSLIAFGNGGLFGTGLGEGRQKQFYLPESHTDFIMAVIGEEMGLVWVLALIVAFAFLIWRIFLIARRGTDRFAALAAAGMGILLATQAIANMGVVMGLLPPKGLTLPLVSYGGSSLVIVMGGIGILLALSRTVPR